MSHRARISAFSNSAVLRVLPIALLVTACSLCAFAKKKGSGDFNGDGYADLCIGVPNYTVGTKTNAGAVNCLYGSAGGLQATGKPAAQLWTQDTDGVQGVSEKGDYFGTSLAAGDFNGDGYDDLCIAVPEERVSGTVLVGSVNCIYGSGTGLQSTGVGGPPPQLWDPATLGITPTDSLEIGYSLIAGDFNHDGSDDLCIGAVGAYVNGVQGAGTVVCLFGSSAGLVATGAQTFSRATPGIGGKVSEFAYFGSSLIAADFNGDGFDDLCVGAYDDTESGEDYGSVTCIYGSSSGLQAKANGGIASQYWWPGMTSLKGGTGNGFDFFARTLAVGDFNHDGYADLAIGAPQDINGGTGKVNVIYGSASGLQITGAGAPDDQLWTRDSASVKGGSGNNWDFGEGLTAGDFNHDGYDDLCIGVPGASGNAQRGGSVSCLYGSSTGLQATGTGGPDDQLWDQDSDGVIGTTEAGDNFGWALSAGDFNGDGFLDLAIGVPGENSGSGAINVLYGFGSGLTAGNSIFLPNQFWHQASDGVPGSGGGSFGNALSQ